MTLRHLDNPSFPPALVAPGPTQVPPEVLEVMARPILHHRSSLFREALRAVRDGLQEIAQSEYPVLLLTCTGTAATESAVVNLARPGAGAAVVAAGYFGERWVELAELYGLDVVPVRYDWGAVPSPADLEEALRRRPDVRTVYLVHSETSTGVVLDLKAFTEVAKSAGALLVVDAVSSFAAVPIETDAWGIDVLITSSHKALMTPPGLAFLFLSPAALEAAGEGSQPRFYLDWARNLATQVGTDPETWFSPAVSLVTGLEQALRMIEREGLDAVYSRHISLGRRCRAAVKQIGLELFSPDDDSAAVMTAVRMPEGVDSSDVVQAMHDDGRVAIGDGEAKLKGSIVRIGHLGYVAEADVDRAVRALGSAVESLSATSKPRLSTGMG